MKSIVTALMALVFGLSITACQTTKKECPMMKNAKCDMKKKECAKR